MEIGQLVLDRSGKYQGVISDIVRDFYSNDCYIQVNEDFEVNLWDCEEIINLSNPCYPSSYIRLK